MIDFHSHILPGIDDVIKEVKLEDRIIVHLIPGLI